jgi:serine/threonine protein kinase
MKSQSDSDASRTLPAELASFIGYSSGAEAARRLAEYEITTLLGRGTYGAVRLATHKPSGASFAVKTVTKAILARKKKESLVEMECSILSKIRHPNIVSLREWIEEEDKYSLFFELASGGELLDRIDMLESFTESSAAAVVATLLNALAYCHDHGLIHRDIKAENLVWKHKGPNAPLCLVDFGISRILDVSEGPPEDMLKSICGSLAYCSPEVLKRVGYGLGADVWAAGCIAYILLSGGQHPFFSTDEDIGIAGLCTRIVKADFHFSPEPFGRVSELGKQFLRTILDPDPTTRPSAHAALNHEWIRTCSPPGYLEFLMEINEEAEWEGMSVRDRKAMVAESGRGIATAVESEDDEPDREEAETPLLRTTGDTRNRRGTLHSLGRRGSIFTLGRRESRRISVIGEPLAPNILHGPSVKPTDSRPDLLEHAEEGRSKAKEKWSMVLKLVSCVKVWEGVAGAKTAVTE